MKKKPQTTHFTREQFEKMKKERDSKPILHRVVHNSNVTSVAEQLAAANRYTGECHKQDDRIHEWDNDRNCHVPRNGPYTRSEY